MNVTAIAGVRPDFRTQVDEDVRANATIEEELTEKGTNDENKEGLPGILYSGERNQR